MAKRNKKNLVGLISNFFKLVGKPLYLLVSALVIGLIFAVYLLGHSVSSLKKINLKRLKINIKIQKIKGFKKIKFNLPKLPKINIPKIRLPKVKLPQISLPTPKKKFKFPIYRSLFFFSILALIFWALILKDLPSPTELTTRNLEVSTKIYDRNGVLLYKIYKNQNRSPVKLSEVPVEARLATLAAEDAEFYNHPGFSIKGILRSIFTNIKKGELSGGSTITQQLVKNALLSPEKTLTRKIREIILSVETEVLYSKDEILEMYLNEVSYGGTAYGIEEASLLYFSKDAKDLDLAEAAFLAGLPKSPTKYSPHGTSANASRERQNEVLTLMRVNGFITKDQEEKAKAVELKIEPLRTGIKAPHFVMYVKQLLVDKYGESAVEKGGLDVTTTLDYQVQEMAEKVVKDEVTKSRGLGVGNGASVVINPQTGEILAMVGSKDYFDTTSDGNVNVAVALRQPGSSIKVVNYLYALAHGYTAATIIDDSPVSFVVPGQPTYIPKNYDDKFRGKITLRSALAESRNIPAVRVLAANGVGNMIDIAEKMGITTWGDRSQYGLSLTLGGGDVRLLDLAQVFATIANYGNRPDVFAISKVKDYKGNILEENNCAQENNCKNENVVDPRAAFILIDILRDNAARSPAFGANSALVIPKHPEVAVKTGTSNNLRDNLTVGFTNKYLVAVWVGNNDGRPMSRIASGITGAAPIWRGIMSRLLSSEPTYVWEAPEGLKQVPCPSKMEWFFAETDTKKYCSSEIFKKIDEEKKKREGDILETGASTSL